MKESSVSDRREDLLDKVSSYILRNGLADLSLRPLARAIKTSPRMLLYFFDTKERLISVQNQIAEWRAKNPKMPVPTIDLRCIQENDPTVDKEWRSSVRRLGQWRQFGHVYSVYYYHEPEALTLSGAYVLALQGHTWEDKPELNDIFVDQRSCDAQLAIYKDVWRQDQDLEREAKHDPALRAKIQEWKKQFDEDERKARGACIPIVSAKPLLENYCEDLPLRLDVLAGLGSYRCDFEIMKPY